jgi:diaminopimelate epimerase
MDSPILEGLKIPTTINKNPIIDEAIKINGKEYLFTAVSMGNPHAVIFVKDLENIDYDNFINNINEVNIKIDEITNEIKNTLKLASKRD